MINYNPVVFQTSVATQAQLFPSDLPEIVFAGKSNVGKSSLINKLCSRKALAHTGNTPGKTQTINFYQHPQFRLVDLPGYGYAKRSQEKRADWGMLIEQYFDGRRDIRLVCALIDVRHEPSTDDRLMLDFLLHMGLPFVIAATKSDKLKPRELEEFSSYLSPDLARRVIYTSAVTGNGIDLLKLEIEKALEKKFDKI